VTVKINPNYKATLVILNDVEAHELVQFNPEYADEEFFENFLEFEEAFTHSFVNVIKTLDSSQKDHDNMSIFTIYSELSYIISHLEVITKILKAVINPTMIKSDLMILQHLNR